MFNDAAIPFWTAVGAIAAVLAVIGAFVGWVLADRRRSQRERASKEALVLRNKARRQETLKRETPGFRRIIDAADPELEAAYDVYCSGITNPDERDSFKEIQRWLDENKFERAEAKRLGVEVELDEYLLIGSIGGEPCSFFYGQYYAAPRLFLIGYLVNDSKNLNARRATTNGLLAKMFELLQAEHPKCAGVVFELALEEGRSLKAHLGKEDRFAIQARTIAGITLKRLDLEYYQPKISLWDPNCTSQRQHLIYGRLKGAPLGGSVPKDEVIAVLDAIYNKWYGDYFVADDPARDAEYRAYVRSVFDEVTGNLPDSVPTL